MTQLLQHEDHAEMSDWSDNAVIKVIGVGGGGSVSSTTIVGGFSGGLVFRLGNGD